MTSNLFSLLFARPDVMFFARNANRTTASSSLVFHKIMISPRCNERDVGAEEAKHLSIHLNNIETENANASEKLKLFPSS